MVEGTFVSLPEVKLGIIPGAGGTQRLARLIGPGRAKSLIFTGRRVQAQEALALGLVESLAPVGELMQVSVALAATILEGAPIALAQAKRAIDQGLNETLEAGLAIERDAYAVTIPTEDRREALAAFQERRAPVFKGG
jgi:enoyl-CoA hydratase/carnithine racemase